MQSLLFSHKKKLRKKCVNLDIKTLGQKCINYYKSPKYVAEKVSLKPRTCSLDIYGISSQHFDTSLKLLLFVTKFKRAKLTVFAFSDYNFGKIQIICGVRTSRTPAFRTYDHTSIIYPEEDTIFSIWPW